MKALTTKTINGILKQNPVTKKSFIGTFAGCILPSKNAKQYSFITNTDLHHQSGEHWNAWIVKENKIIFFDSFGRDPRDTSFPDNYKDILENFNDLEYSKVQIQSFNSVTCGYFCIHFIYVLSLGLDLEFFLNEYSNNFMKNDEFVVDFVNSL